LGPESEDEDDEPLTVSLIICLTNYVVDVTQVFSSVTNPPIIKKVVSNGRTLVYRIQGTTSMDQDSEITSASAPPKSQSVKSKNLVRRVTGDSTSYPSMIGHQLEDEDIEGKYFLITLAFCLNLTTLTELEPSKGKQKETPEISKRKETPTTMSAETTVVTKKIKLEGSGSRNRVRTADFDELTRSVIEETISIYRAQIGGVEPFPERSDDRDTVKQAWLEVCTGRNVRVELEEDMFKLVSEYNYSVHFAAIFFSLQIVGRASQARGYAKTTSKPYFVSAYKIDSHGSKRETRDNVEQVLEGARFIYKVNN
jgi:hypothetical protein